MTISNKLKSIHNPENFQYIDEAGKPLKITELSREDLMQVVCDCMTTLEALEQKSEELLAVLHKWRTST